MEGVKPMIKYFDYRETIDRNPDRVIIVPVYDNMPLTLEHGGSYALAPARVLGLTYPDYLRFLRESFPEVVSVEGRDSLYPVAYWKKGKELFTFISLLNAKMELAIQEAKASEEGEDEEELLE